MARQTRSSLWRGDGGGVVQVCQASSSLKEEDWNGQVRGKMSVEISDRRFVPLVTPRLGDVSKQEEGLS